MTDVVNLNANISVANGEEKRSLVFPQICYFTRTYRSNHNFSSLINREKCVNHCVKCVLMFFICVGSRAFNVGTSISLYVRRRDGFFIFPRFLNRCGSRAPPRGRGGQVFQGKFVTRVYSLRK